MEASSPLAAMQPPSFGIPAWGRTELYTSHPHSHISSGNNFGPGAFNFKDLSMKRSSSDYFAMKPVRGSSPTASLAADLSQNFHIDMSPQLPTPRRSLFTSNLFGTIDGRDIATTPPLPSSSPGPLHEMMDISPLPHKQPFYYQIEVASPSPADKDNDNEMASSPSAQESRTSSMADRKKPGLLRPNLSRTKNFSTNTMPRSKEAQDPKFKFAAGSSKLSTSTSMSLGECFGDSPPQERRPRSANSPTMNMGPPRPRQPFANLANSIRSGSPISTHSRRSNTNPLVRPRKQYRRTLSMFESAGDIVNRDESASSALQAVMDIDEIPQPSLPHFFQEGHQDSIPRVTKETMLQVLDGKFNCEFDQRMVVDCRFEYEFEGGHIDGAVNYNDKEQLSTQLFQSSLPGKTLLIFHCEYSAHRAPIMARFIRQQDRATNAEQYPKLTYPEIYILDGGYSAFFSDSRERCTPQNYVEMNDKDHVYTCEREMGRLRQNRSKLSRAQTFAFGQHGSPQLDDSPTAAGRSRSDVSMMDSLGSSPMLGYERSKAQRMASY